MPLDIEYLFLKRNPFIKLTFVLIIGVVVSYYNALNNSILVGLFFLSLALVLILFLQKKWIISYRNNYLFGILIYISVFIFGLSYSNYYIHFESETHFAQLSNHNSILKGTCIEAPVLKKRSVQYLIEINKVIDGHFEKETNGKLLAYFPKENLDKLPQIGDVIYFKTQINQISPPSNPQQFDYKSYLNRKGINHQAYISINQFTIEGSKNSFYRTAQNIRSLFIANLRKSGLQEKELSIISALLLGDKQSLSQEAKESYSKAGAMHVLAVSGLHVGIVLYLLTYLFNFIFGKSKNTFIKTVLTILFIWAFAFVTGLSISVLRSAVMFSFIAAGSVLKHKISIFNTLALSAFVILLINPLFVFDVGFQLSYAAVIGIIVIHPKIYNLLYVKNKILDYAWSITVVSIAAQISTFPISIYYFHQVPIYALLSNLFVISLATILLILGIISIVISFIPQLLFIVYWLLYPVIFTLNFIIKTIADFPFATINSLHISIFEVSILYAFIVITFVYFTTKKTIHLNISLGLLALLFLSDHIENYHLKHKTDFYIYNVKNQLAINITNSNTNELKLSSNDDYDKKRIIRLLKNNWGFLDAPSPIIKTLDHKKNYILTIKDKRIAIINTSVNSKLAPKLVNLVLIGFNAKNMTEIATTYPSNRYIFNNNIWKKKRTKLLVDSRNLNLNTFDISKDGYWMLDCN